MVKEDTTFPLCMEKMDQSNGFQTMDSVGALTTLKLSWGDWGKATQKKALTKIRLPEFLSLLYVGSCKIFIFEHRDLLLKEGRERERA